ncbi:MAG: endonuclease/exonuclease/phosphatase family protein [Alphaproteobacteria bacterium]|nr:endonuclease/exonuclease/phosphatase family protein [Alphaproteobacteria bacterium]
MTRIVDRTQAPTLAERQAVIDAPVAPASFEAAFARFATLHEIEQRAPRRPAPPRRPARIAFWNAERLKYLDASIALLDGLGADVLMLCEVDVGMARTGNRHTIAALADALDAGYVFGTEFVELGLGDLREQAWHAGQTNRDGLHGGGFVARVPLRRPALVRLEASGRWFDGVFHERRVGGRIAMLAELAIEGGSVLLASAHYESHTGPADRLAQTRVMLDAIDAHAPGMPVLIGGDFNTSTFELAQKRDPAHVAAALAREPGRLVAPMGHEPMFELLDARGYDWAGCNAMGVGTQRTRPDGTPAPPFGKIDWLFARGLRCSEAATLPAVDAGGVAVSDHEVLAVSIALA